MTRGLARLAAASAAVLFAAAAVVPAFAQSVSASRLARAAASVRDVRAFTLAPTSASTPARLDVSLAMLAAARESSGTADARALAAKSRLRVAGDRVAVIVQPAPRREATAASAIRAAGAVPVEGAAGVLGAMVPIASLEKLAASDGVLRVRPPAAARPASTMSEGVPMVGAPAWHAKGVDGTGVKVGIIDAGFRDLAAKQAAGSLPASLQVGVFDWENAIPGPDKTDGSLHGCGVAEVVHETAPGASLYLAVIHDEIDLAHAEKWMRDNGVRVVNMSLGWIALPLDGGGSGGHAPIPGSDPSVNRVINTAVSTDGIFWANAAGNYRMSHWRGDFVDRERTGALDWGGGERLDRFYYDPYTGPLEGHLWWRDSWTNAINDYDLMLGHFDDVTGRFQLVALPQVEGMAVGSSRQWGRTGDQPYEDVVVDGLPQGYYAWVVVNRRPSALDAVAGQHRWLPANSPRVDFDFLCPNGDLSVYRPERSLMTPADNMSSGFMAAGAISAYWRTTRATNPFGELVLDHPGFAQEEPYSSEGPNLWGAVLPEIVAPDDVSNEVYGSPPSRGFRGTSASSPHLAGVAALIAQAKPTVSPAWIESYIKSKAIGLLQPGPDMRTGWGAVQLPPLTTPTVEVGRVAGGDRYLTALAVSKQWAAGSAPQVVLASGAAFPDALAGDALAGALHSPVLLTAPGALRSDVLAEIRRLTSGAATPAVHVLGGTTAVSGAIERQLTRAGFRVVRHAGPTRYQTAADVANAVLSIEPTDTAFIVNGEGFADALAAAPVAYARGIPVLPVTTGAVPDAVARVISARHIRHAVIVGGKNVVGPSVESALAKAGVTVDERAEGWTRYDTAKALAEYAAGRGWVGFGRVGIASGVAFPDALAGAADVGRAGGPLLLTAPDALAAQTGSELLDRAPAIASVRLFGGESALQGAVLLSAKMKSSH